MWICSLPYAWTDWQSNTAQPQHNNRTIPVMIYKYKKWPQAGPLNTEHKEMILSWKVLAYKLIITEVFQSNEEFDNPLPCI